ncbi:MAG: glycoside hydrolase domain-containing protein [Marmoricola sp.]
MPSRSVRPVTTAISAALVALLAAGLLLLPGVDGEPAHAADNPVTPGTFTGRGFDQCNAPSQQAMSAWRRSSPYRAVGIYISGNSRFCREQPHLTPAWVGTQLAAGWHLLPITLGPQAHCQPRFPRYGADIDPTIRPRSRDTYANARAQAVAEARTAVAAAQRLGIVPGSTLFYDLEAFDLHHSRDCTQSALWFLSAWSNQLHADGYLAGVYSSAGSAIAALDTVRLDPPQGFVLPDQVWLARWDRKKNTSAPGYLSDEGWAGQQRVKQYVGGHDETWGGVRIAIDRDYLDLHARAVPAPVPGPPSLPSATPAPTPTERTDGLADPRCSSRSISRTRYRRTDAAHHRGLVVPLQCLLKQQYLYRGAVTGHWDARTLAALHAYQHRVGHRRSGSATRADWMSLTAAGSSDRVLRRGSHGADVVRLQRALNAAGPGGLHVTGGFDRATRRAVARYQHAVLGRATGVVAELTWRALHGGRR